MAKYQDANVSIIRTISHDFKEPLRSVRWYLRKLREGSDMDRSAALPIEDFEEVVKITQKDFQRFYDDYRNKRIALPEFRSFIRTILQNNMRILESSWERLYPAIRGVKFVDPRMARYPELSVTSLNETVKRILRRYDGLLRYLNVRQEPVRTSLGLHNEVNKVVGDLQAIIISEQAQCAVLGGLVGKFDQILISFIFQNLIVNSIKYRDRHRKPEISIRMGTTRLEEIVGYLPNTLEFERNAHNGGLVGFVVYSDNGRGIPPQFAEAAFQPFIRVNPRDPAGGSGMGLAIVKSAVEAHGGRVWLNSKLGIGTTFFMLYPLEEGSQLRLTPAATVRAWFEFQGGRN